MVRGLLAFSKAVLIFLFLIVAAAFQNLSKVGRGLNLIQNQLIIQHSNAHFQFPYFSSNQQSC